MIDVFDALRLAFDTGMLALIWLVQLIIYPGLAMYNDVNLRIWHPIYTKRVTLVVLPLMFGQLILSAYKVLNVGVLTESKNDRLVFGMDSEFGNTLALIMIVLQGMRL